MANRDFWPWSAHNGGHHVVSYARVTAGQTFLAGEFVGVVDAGTLSANPQDDTQILVADFDAGLRIGVAAADAADALTNMGGICPFFPVNEGTKFITTKIRDTGAIDTQIVPTGAMVGENFQITGTNLAPIETVVETGVAGVAGTDVVAHVDHVLNARGEPIAAADTTTGRFMVFSLTARL